jgi:hypothetical protein
MESEDELLSGVDQLCHGRRLGWLLVDQLIGVRERDRPRCFDAPAARLAGRGVPAAIRAGKIAQCQ